MEKPAAGPFDAPPGRGGGLSEAGGAATGDRGASSVRLAVVPAAGLGTRLVPASLAVPKELLPLGVHPAILACLLEADAAGLRELCVVLSPGKEAIRRFLDPAAWPQLPAALREGPALSAVRALIERLRITFAEQPEPAGVRDAVERGQRAVGARLWADPCAVLYPDLLHLPDQRALAALLRAHAACGAEATVFAVHDAGRPGLRHGSAARVELDLTGLGASPGAPSAVDPAAQAALLRALRPGTPLPIRRLVSTSGPAQPGELRTTFGEVQGAALGRLLHQEGRGADGRLDDRAYFTILNRLAQAGQLFGTVLPGEVLDLGTAAGYRDAARRFGAGEATLRELGE